MAQDSISLELFVRGQSARSLEAIQLVRRICQERLPGRFELEVIDIVQQPERVRAAGVIAVPTLVRRQPAPVLNTAGELTEARILAGLGMP